MEELKQFGIIPIDFKHLCERTHQFGSMQEGELTIESFKLFLKEKIRKTDINLVKADVSPFLKDQSVMNIWSTVYFPQLVDMIRFTN